MAALGDTTGELIGVAGTALPGIVCGGEGVEVASETRGGKLAESAGKERTAAFGVADGEMEAGGAGSCFTARGKSAMTSRRLK